MNRKEGIIVGCLLLGTFVTGVFAIPEQQLLNVFVTNFPQNEVRRVLDQNKTATSDVVSFKTGIIDVSQFSHVTAFYKITFSSDVSPSCPSGSSVIGLSIGLEQVGDFPTDQASDSFSQPCAGSANQGNLTLNINGPNLSAFMTAIPVHATAGTIRGEITLFLQK